MESQVVIIDNGTGYIAFSHFLFLRYTKMGYAGNVEPSHIIPTVLADHLDKVI
jgi:hypothetical protein